MRISVFGLGYVGVVTMACFAEEGHDVIGIDVAKRKVELLNAGKSPIIEEQLGDLIEAGVKRGNLRATCSASEALRTSEIAIVCVGTPSLSNGTLDQTHILQVTEEIGKLLAERKAPLLLVMRSTMVPGTLQNLLIPVLEKASGRKLGNGYDVVFHPEFLREGSSVWDFFHPPKIVIGEGSPGAAQLLLDLYGARYDAPRIVCEVQVAEMVKYCDNLFHAIKVTFANEIGQFCQALEIDAQQVMDIFCQDRKLNISSKYLRPGFAFGGSCLPKDLRAFLAVARQNDLKLPMLEGILPSNEAQVARALREILATEAQSIGFYGMAFKKGTDDLRESPYVELAERLLGKGKDLVCFDERVRFSRLVGGNKSYAETKFPHLMQLLTDQVEDLLRCDLILVCHAPEVEIADRWQLQGRQVIDLTGINEVRAKIVSPALGSHRQRNVSPS